MTNVTRSMYHNSCIVKVMQEDGNGTYKAISEAPVSYIDSAPLTDAKAIELSGVDGPTIITNRESKKVTFGMALTDFIQHGKIIK